MIVHQRKSTTFIKNPPYAAIVFAIHHQAGASKLFTELSKNLSRGAMFLSNQPAGSSHNFNIKYHCIGFYENGFHLATLQIYNLFLKLKSSHYNRKILGSESFARWLVSLALELELALALDIEHYHITASVSYLPCPLPPHHQSELVLVLELELALALALALELALDIEHYHITTSVMLLTCPLPPGQSVI